ncbi:MAG: TIGR01777 family oxidoreductase [Actinobacteria bacterium]|nr:TIGR01777 family oxidoreductase [Actinomycetota bacterium]
MRVAVTGSSGLIGDALVSSLRADGHTVHRVVRSREAAVDGDLYWSVERGEIDAEGFAGVDAVVHLAGEPLGEHRWDDETKRRIRASRVDGTRLLSEALAGLSDPPSVLVSGSAVGYYGSRGDEILTEAAGPGDDFLAEVVVAWEAAADPARDAGIRVAHPRTGVVIAERGPLIDKVRLPFSLGIGGRIGDGRQWVPWISLEDEVRALRFLLDGDLDGPVNLVAPNPVQNRELTEALGEVLRRPTIIPTPLLGIRVLYGEMGVSLATTSQRVVPRRLQDAGFAFGHPTLRPALRLALAG